MPSTAWHWNVHPDHDHEHEHDFQDCCRSAECVCALPHAAHTREEHADPQAITAAPECLHVRFPQWRIDAWLSGQSMCPASHAFHICKRHVA